MDFVLYNLRLKGLIILRHMRENLLNSILLLSISVYLSFTFLSYSTIGHFSLINLHLGLILYIHLNRSDIGFLKHISSKQYKSLMVQEYLVLSLPFIMIYLLIPYSAIYLAVTVFFCGLVPTVRITKGISFNVPYFLSKESFEWIYFFRSIISYYFLGLLFLVIGYFFINTTMLIMLCITFGVLITHFIYSLSEPNHYIFAYSCLAKTFLRRKVSLILSNYILLFLPPLILISLNHENWFWILYVLISIISVLNLLFLKYTLYQNNLLMKLMFGFNLGFFICTFINPILLGVYAISTPLLARKAYRNIKFLLG